MHKMGLWAMIKIDKYHSSAYNYVLSNCLDSSEISSLSLLSI